MPASTLDPVNAALRSALSKNDGENPLDAQLAGASKKALLADVEFEPAGSYQSTVLDKLKSKYIVLKNSESETPQASKPEGEMGADETLKLASYELYPIDAVQLGWSKCDWAVGAGMINMGNTCYLNSTLQALFHVPALVNWLISDKEHTSECQDSGGLCIICAMRKTLQDSQQRNTTTIRPLLIYNKLRLVCRNLIPGRQEDAHEFLRYLVEAMEKSYLSRFKNHSEFDSKVKETTPLNQILGGYLRSAVRCLKCGHVSTTFQHFQDLLLDIRKAQTLDEALEGYFAREKLDDDSYHCQSCQKKVPATKQFSLERAPMVLCIQLKRFSVSNNKITKHINFRQRLDITKFARHRPSVPLIYRLVALVTHMGPTVNCGHYTAVAQTPTGSFYQFDDSMVRMISHQAVFNTNAYIMLYELESSPFNQKATNTSPSKIKSPLVSPEASSNAAKSNGVGFTSDKVYGPELPPDRLAEKKTNGTAVLKQNVNGNGKHAIESPATSDSDSESSPTAINSNNNNNNSKKSDKERKIVPLTPPPSPKKIISNSTNEVTTNNNNNSNNRILQNDKLNNSNNKDKSSIITTATSTIANAKDSKSVTTAKLVPYETDDSSCSDESSNPNEPEYRVSTKAAVGDWKVTSTEPSTTESNNSNKNNNSNNNNNSSGVKSWNERNCKTDSSNTVSELFKMSHSGYAAPVSSWNGTRSQLDKEVNAERREIRKRALSDDADQGRVKHQRTNNCYKSNPGYNPIQEFHNAKNWNSNSGSGHYNRNFYNTSGRHRRHFNNHKSFHKNHRFRQ